MVGIVVIQFLFMVWGDRIFRESMNDSRHMLEQELITGGMPQQHVRALSSAMRKVRYEISARIREMVWLLQITTVTIFALTSKEGSQETRHLDTEREV